MDAAVADAAQDLKGGATDVARHMRPCFSVTTGGRDQPRAAQ